jgi:hypothetical protein
MKAYSPVCINNQEELPRMKPTDFRVKNVIIQAALPKDVNIDIRSKSEANDKQVKFLQLRHMNTTSLGKRHVAYGL